LLTASKILPQPHSLRVPAEILPQPHSLRVPHEGAAQEPPGPGRRGRGAGRPAGPVLVRLRVPAVGGTLPRAADELLGERVRGAGVGILVRHPRLVARRGRSFGTPASCTGVVGGVAGAGRRPPAGSPR